MLVRFMPELGKYAMNSLTVMLLFLLVFVSTVTKDILEAKNTDGIKKQEMVWNLVLFIYLYCRIIQLSLKIL